MCSAKCFGSFTCVGSLLILTEIVRLIETQIPTNRIQHHNNCTRSRHFFRLIEILTYPCPNYRGTPICTSRTGHVTLQFWSPSSTTKSWIIGAIPRPDLTFSCHRSLVTTVISVENERGTFIISSTGNSYKTSGIFRTARYRPHKHVHFQNSWPHPRVRHMRTQRTCTNNDECLIKNKKNNILRNLTQPAQSLMVVFHVWRTYMYEYVHLLVRISLCASRTHVWVCVSPCEKGTRLVIFSCFKTACDVVPKKK